MAFCVLTGRARDVKRALLLRLSRAQDAGEHPILLLVPAQYTLQAELDALGEEGAGSFRLQVLSPGRLHLRVFEQAGWPKGARIDEQGRVMLVHSAAQRARRRLLWYGSSVGRRGFAERVLGQIEGFKQAGIAPGDVREMAEQASGALAHKLADLALLYEEYESALADRFLDGEDEAREAIARMGGAQDICDAEVFVYGFDLVSVSLAETILALSATALTLTLALALDDEGPDRDLYQTVSASLNRLLRMARERGVAHVRECAEEQPEPGSAEIRHLERELFAHRPRRLGGAPGSIELAQLNNPQDEAQFAASQARELVMARGWRWRDVAVVCQTLDEGYEAALRRAFAEADVPLFLPSARPADRSPAAQALLSALRLLARGWQRDDMVDYIRAGFTGLGDDEADQLVNHILHRGLRGRALKGPLRNLRDDQAALEQARETVAAPLIALDEATKKQRDTHVVLGAVFQFLEDIRMCDGIEAQQRQLIALGQREWAMEGAQVWNRILQALDQMHELMQGEALTLREAGELLNRSLSVSEVKPLPQSGDAVLCGSIGHMKSVHVRALLVLGLSDQGVPGEAQLLSERELHELGILARMTSALGSADRQRMQRLGLKGALAFTDDYLLLSYPMSDTKGSARLPGALIQQIKRVLPELKPVSWFGEGGGQLRRIRLNAPQAARNHLGAMRRDAGDDPNVRAAALVLGERFTPPEPEPPRLPEALAARLFEGITLFSPSRLEGYTECPYKHFAHYALRPREFLEFGLNFRDEGTFYHDAMQRFMTRHREALPSLSPQESMARMDEVTSELIEDTKNRALGEGALAEAEAEQLRQVARRAAATVVSQLSGSQFAPTGIEIDFGADGTGIRLQGGATLAGRIDRMDEYRGGEALYLRVIDYKTRGKSFDLAEAYYGLQMQLMVYLAAATAAQGGRPAGAFYFPLTDKLVDIESRDPDEVERARLDKLRLSGLAVNDEQVVAAMAENPKEVIKGAQVDPGDFDRLIRHTVRRAERACRDLRAGVIEPRPAVLGSRSACEYCDYTVLCQSELSPKPNKLPGLSGREVWERLREDEDLTPPDRTDS